MVMSFRGSLVAQDSHWRLYSEDSMRQSMCHVLAVRKENMEDNSCCNNRNRQERNRKKWSSEKSVQRGEQMAQCCHKKKTNNLTSGVTVFLQHCAGGAYQVTGSVVERNWWFHHCQLCLGASFQGDLQEVTSCLPTVGSCQQFLYLIQWGLVNNFQITWLLLFTRLTINV